MNTDLAAVIESLYKYTRDKLAMAGLILLMYVGSTLFMAWKHDFDWTFVLSLSFLLMTVFYLIMFPFVYLIHKYFASSGDQRP